MNMIEKNYKTWCAQNDIPLEDGPAEDVGMAGAEDGIETLETQEDELMDIDEDDDIPSFFNFEPKKEVKKKSRGKVGDLVRQKVKKVLDETGLGPQRAGKCDEADFLKYVYPNYLGQLYVFYQLPIAELVLGYCMLSIKKAFTSVEGAIENAAQCRIRTATSYSAPGDFLTKQLTLSRGTSGPGEKHGALIYDIVRYTSVLGKVTCGFFGRLGVIYVI